MKDYCTVCKEIHVHILRLFSDWRFSRDGQPKSKSLRIDPRLVVWANLAYLPSARKCPNHLFKHPRYPIIPKYPINVCGRQNRHIEQVDSRSTSDAHIRPRMHVHVRKLSCVLF